VTRTVAVVTGAGSGIGRAVGRALLDAGWAVALAGRRAAPLEETAGGSDAALVVPTDVADPESVTDLFAAARGEWGRVDLLVNNAGTFGPVGEVDEIPVEGWLSTVAVNLTGSFLCARAAVATMKAQDPRGGRIINNGSISAYAPRPNSAPYTAAKHAISGLTKSTALDGRKYDIACGQVDVGNAATDMTERMTAGVQQANGSIEVEPRMDVQHVASAVAYMASLPPDANVLFLTVMATKMPFVGRG
jgi:NAD(P)-dependent dehydrogenase (short-subunit alcohol dehydrogenase family)